MEGTMIPAMPEQALRLRNEWNLHTVNISFERILP